MINGNHGPGFHVCCVCHWGVRRPLVWLVGVELLVGRAAVEAPLAQEPVVQADVGFAQAQSNPLHG